MRCLTFNTRIENEAVVEVLRNAGENESRSASARDVSVTVRVLFLLLFSFLCFFS